MRRERGIIQVYKNVCLTLWQRRCSIGFMCKHSKEIHSEGLGVIHTVGNAWKREEHESSAV